MDSQSIIVNELYPRVEAGLKNPAKQAALVKGISAYIDRNSHILFSLNLSTRLIIGEHDRTLVFDTLGISEKEIHDIINKSQFGKIEWVMRPFSVALLMCVRFFELHNKHKETELCSIYLSFLYYTLMHAKIFVYLPNKEIMDYTLHKNPNVTNNFIIKREGSVFGMIKHTVMTSHELYINSIVKPCTDKDVNDYLSSIRTRIGSNLKNIMQYFREDHREGHFFNKDHESYEEESYQVTDSTSLAIAKLANKTSLNIASFGFAKSHTDIVANMSIDTSAFMLHNIMHNIIDQFRLDLDEFITHVIELYVIEGGNNINEVGSKKFIAHAMSLYKTNSTKPRVIKMKDILDKWINAGSVKHGVKIIRPATINAYRKAVFTVFVYTIAKESK